MPLTTLDPDTAFIVIDLQQGIVNGNFIHPIAAIVHRTCAPIDAFRAQNLSAALVNVAGRPPGRTEQGPRANIAFSKVWTRLLPDWIGSQTISPSPSEAGAPLPPPT